MHIDTDNVCLEEIRYRGRFGVCFVYCRAVKCCKLMKFGVMQTPIYKLNTTKQLLVY